MILFAFDACVNFCLLSPSTGFFLFFVAQKGSPYFWCPQYAKFFKKRQIPPIFITFSHLRLKTPIEEGKKVKKWGRYVSSWKTSRIKKMPSLIIWCIDIVFSRRAKNLTYLKAGRVITLIILNMLLYIHSDFHHQPAQKLNMHINWTHFFHFAYTYLSKKRN